MTKKVAGCVLSFFPDSHTSIIPELVASCSHFQSCKMNVKFYYALFTRLVNVQVCKYFHCEHRRCTSVNIGYFFTYAVHIG